MFSFDTGMMKSVVISDLDILKKCLEDSNFDGRDFVPEVQVKAWKLLKGSVDHGVINASGQLWKEQRRFTLHKLKDFGFGRALMEGSVMEEVNELCDNIKEWIKASESITLDGKINLASFNALLNILASKRLDINNPKHNVVFQKINTLFEFFGLINIPVNVAMVIYHYTGYKNGTMKLLEREFKFFFDVLKSYLAEHEETFDEDNMRDFVDCYIKEMREVKENNDVNSSFYGEFGKTNYLNTMFDLVMAGAETTATTLRHAFVYLMNNPDVQKKAQKELDDKIGNSRLLTMADRDDLPYLNALILEVQRCGNVAPLSLPHTNNSPASVGKYKIPSKTLIFPNLYSIHRNPKHFKDPNAFNPDRFIDPATGNFNPHPAVVPFSVGRRYCPGMTLAKMEVYLFLGALLQQFTFSMCPDAPIRPDDVIVELTRGPKPFKMKIELRNNWEE